MIHKTITVELTPRGIASAIREIERFKRQLKAWCDDLVRTLVDEGVVIAKMNVMHMNAVFTGELEESIQGVFFPAEGKGVIFTDVPHALYVEYGTGIVGAGSPHPEPESAEWVYDIHHHGESGWVYFLTTDNINRFVWTKGMASRPFMYNTLRWLEQNADRIAAGVQFGE